MPVTVDDGVAAALPAAVVRATFPAQDEVSVVMPGRETMAKHGTALNRMTTHTLEQNRVCDLGRPRHILLDGCVELAMRVWVADDEPVPS